VQRPCRNLLVGRTVGAQCWWGRWHREEVTRVGEETTEGEVKALHVEFGVRTFEGRLCPGPYSVPAPSVAHAQETFIMR
jgi:hypothetical protein